MSEDSNMMETLLRAVFAGIDIRNDTGDPAVTLPDGFKLWNPAQLKDKPSRRRGTVHLYDPESFADYVGINGGRKPQEEDGPLYDRKTMPAIFHDADKNRFVAVFDWLDGWREDRALLDLLFSPECYEWRNRNGKAMEQHEFAEFIEDRLPDISDPAGADMLEMALNLEAQKSASVKSTIRPHDGSVRFHFQEDVQGSGMTSQGQQVAVPEKFTIRIPYFRGSTAIEITARMRFRLNSGKLKFWYDLLHLDQIALQEFDKVRARLERELLGCNFFAGLAPTVEAPIPVA